MAPEPVGIAREAIEEAAPAPLIDALEAAHAELAHVDRRDREVVRGVRVVVVVVLLLDLERVPADAFAPLVHPVLAAAPVAGAEQRGQLVELPAGCVRHLVRRGEALEELVLGRAVGADP